MPLSISFITGFTNWTAGFSIGATKFLTGAGVFFFIKLYPFFSTLSNLFAIVSSYKIDSNCCPFVAGEFPFFFAFSGFGGGVSDFPPLFFL